MQERSALAGGMRPSRIPGGRGSLALRVLGSPARHARACALRFAAEACSAAPALLLLEVSSDDHPRLTRRELECLRWTLRGKTAWEVGRILGIAEQTAARHLHNASKKLGCVSKHQAAWRAAHLKLIG